MGSFRNMAVLTSALLLMFLASSFALDMSIIEYDRAHISKANLTESQMKKMYETWLVRHGKNYNALGEKEKRFEIFKDNLRYVNEHNSVERTYKVGLNKFADLTNEEFRKIYLGSKMERKIDHRFHGKVNSQRYLFKGGDELPESVDWREKGAVVPVKDQGQCG